MSAPASLPPLSVSRAGRARRLYDEDQQLFVLISRKLLLPLLPYHAEMATGCISHARRHFCHDFRATGDAPEKTSLISVSAGLSRESHIGDIGGDAGALEDMLKIAAGRGAAAERHTMARAIAIAILAPVAPEMHDYAAA